MGKVGDVLCLAEYSVYYTPQVSLRDVGHSHYLSVCFILACMQATGMRMPSHVWNCPRKSTGDQSCISKGDLKKLG
mgnify:CR=1 FL=1